MKQFQCEVTGRSGLDYFEALQSEKTEARIMHSRFPAPLKPVILQAVQWRACSTSLHPTPWRDALLTVYYLTEIMGRLDHLVEAVYDRYVNRYYKGESTFSRSTTPSLC